MANSNNLIPFTSEQNREEAKKNGQKGGIKSGESRRKRKQLKEQIDYFLSLPFPNLKDSNGNNLRDVFSEFGIEEDEIDNQMAMILSLWRGVITKSDVSAFTALRDTMGEKPKEKVQVSGTLNNPYKELTEEELRKLAGGS